MSFIRVAELVSCHLTLNGHWAPGGGVGNPGKSPSRNWKNNCRNLMLFSKPPVLASTLPEIVGISFFYWGFFQKFQNFRKIFSTICVFRPNARNLHGGPLKYFEKYDKIIHFWNVLKIFFEKSVQKFRKFAKSCLNFLENVIHLCFSFKRAKHERKFLTNFEKYDKTIHFLQFSEDIFSQIFESCPASGRLLPEPLRGRPP